MNLLLDTHIFIWMGSEPAKLPIPIANILRNPEHALFLSIASMWEMQIKVGLGKLHLPANVETFVTTFCQLNTIASLPIAQAHIWTLATLPQYHRDPFDRLLIAQAIAEDYTLVTADPLFTSYPAKLMMT